jgi:hypothetical protein
MAATAARPLTLLQGSWVHTIHTHTLELLALGKRLVPYIRAHFLSLYEALPDLEACLEDLQGLVRLVRLEMQHAQLHATVGHLPSRTAMESFL